MKKKKIIKKKKPISLKSMITRAGYTRELMLNLVFHAIIKMYKNQMFRTEEELENFDRYDSYVYMLFNILGHQVRPTRKEFEARMEAYGLESLESNTLRKERENSSIRRFFLKELGFADQKDHGKGFYG